MKYFSTLPSITQTDWNNNYVSVSNILTRAYLLTNIQKNINLFYEYRIKDFDKIENVAYQYYNDVNRYWLIMYANGLSDALYDWPLNYNVLIDVIVDKYTDQASNALSIPANTITPAQVISYTQSTVHHYEKIILTYDSNSQYQQNTTIQIDQTTYNSLSPSITHATFDNGVVVTKQILKNTVSIYNHEIDINEEKRNIYLIKDVYATDTEKQLKTIMSA